MNNRMNNINIMQCSNCKKMLKNNEIGGMVEIPGIRKYWCTDCWEK